MLLCFLYIRIVYFLGGIFKEITWYNILKSRNWKASVDAENELGKKMWKVLSGKPSEILTDTLTVLWVLKICSFVIWVIPSGFLYHWINVESFLYDYVC